MKEEVAWKEHQIYGDGDEEEEENFDFFGKTEFETQDFDFPGLPTIQIRGHFEETSTSTGLGLWTGSDVMAEFLCNHTELVKDKRALEMGAGLGLIGMVAHHIGASEVLMTDGDTNVLDNLRYNIEKNGVEKEANNNATDRNLHCAQLIWGRNVDEFLQIHGQYDVILAADCVYMVPSLKPLWKTIQKLITPGGTVLFANPSSSQAPIEMVLEVASECGFTWTTVGEAKGKVYIFRSQKASQDISS